MSSSKVEQWRTKLDESQQPLIDLVNALTPEQWAQPVYSEGTEWTVLTAVRHLIESERGMSIQIHKTRKVEPTVPEGFDLDRWNASVDKRMADLSPEQLVEALHMTRAKTVEVMESLNDEDWEKQGRHPSQGMSTIEEYYGIIHGHQLTHTKDIQTALGLA